MDFSIFKISSLASSFLFATFYPFAKLSFFVLVLSSKIHKREEKFVESSKVNLPSILLRSALWRSGFSSANFLRSTFAQTMNAFIGRRIRCSFRLLCAVLPGWHIFTPAGIGEMPCWYSSDGPEASQDMSSSRCCAGPLNIPGIYKVDFPFLTSALTPRLILLSMFHPRLATFSFSNLHLVLTFDGQI